MAHISCSQHHCRHARHGVCQLDEISNTMSFVDPECPYYEQADDAKPGPVSGQGLL